MGTLLGRPFAEVQAEENFDSELRYLGARRLFLSFAASEKGFLLITGDRTMSFEAKTFYVTNDGGESWQWMQTGESAFTLVTGVGFSTEKIGFLSFKVGNGPLFYRTMDGGLTWEQLHLGVPSLQEGSLKFPTALFLTLRMEF